MNRRALQLVTLLGLALVTAASDAKTVKCPVIADTTIITDPHQWHHNFGGGTVLRMRGEFEIAILKYDMSDTKHMWVRKAELFVYYSSLRRVQSNLISTIAVDWVEGKTMSRPEKGACCFRFAEYDTRPWVGAGSTFFDVAFGKGGSLLNSNQFDFDPQSWNRVELDRAVAEALISGHHSGLAIAMDFGDVRNGRELAAKEYRGGAFASYLMIDGDLRDREPPGRVVDVRAKPCDTNGEVCIAWTAPGDDMNRGRVKWYDIRRFTGRIDHRTWADAQRIHNTLTPKPCGAKEELRIPGLQPGKEHFFAIVSYDEAGNESPLSPPFSTRAFIDRTPPARPATLRAQSGPRYGEVRLSWTATGDDGNEGRASAYEIRYSQQPITAKNWSEATLVEQELKPGRPGTQERYAVGGLGPGRSYFFGLKVVDETGTQSPVAATTGAAVATSDRVEPGRVADLAARPGIDRGEVLLTWTAPGDDGKTGTVSSYDVRWSTEPITDATWQKARKAKVIARPRAGGSPEQVSVGGLEADEEYHFALKAVDDQPSSSPLSNCAKAKASGSMWSVWVASDSMKVNPLNGNVYELGPAMYGTASVSEHSESNYVWDRDTKTILLKGARNEFLSFQLVLVRRTATALPDIEIKVSDLKGPGVIEAKKHLEVLKEWYFRIDNAWYPDALLPIELRRWGRVTVPDSHPQAQIPDQRLQAVWVDVHVPRDAAPGTYRGTVTVQALRGEPVTLNIELEVWDFFLSKYLHVGAELVGDNSLHVAFPRVSRRSKAFVTLEDEYYRLAHRHRCTFNNLPYDKNGVLLGCAPALSGKGRDAKVSDWSKWDARFGRYLDGSAFAGLPREGVPVRHFVLPIHENWPSNAAMYDDELQAYSDALIEICEDFQRHCRAKRWTKTIFHILLANQKGSGRCRWDLAEPYTEEDFRMLAFFSTLMHQGFGNARKIEPVFRANLSRMYLLREQLDEHLDLWCVRGELDLKKLKARQAQRDYVWFYDHPYDIAGSSLLMREQPWKAWRLGLGGFSIRDTIGHKSSWQHGTPNKDQRYLIYPGSYVDIDGPLASVRLKALRRGVQDYEYMFYLTHLKKDGGRLVNEILGSRPTVYPRDYHDVRVRLAEEILRARAEGRKGK